MIMSKKQQWTRGRCAEDTESRVKSQESRVGQFLRGGKDD